MNYDDITGTIQLPLTVNQNGACSNLVYAYMQASDSECMHACVSVFLEKHENVRQENVFLICLNKFYSNACQLETIYE